MIQPESIGLEIESSSPQSKLEGSKVMLLPPCNVYGCVCVCVCVCVVVVKSPFQHEQGHHMNAWYFFTGV